MFTGMQKPTEQPVQTKTKKSALASVRAAEMANTTPQTAPRQGTNRNQRTVEAECQSKADHKY